MKKNKKLIIIGLIFSLCLCLTIVFVLSKLYDYLIVLFPLTIIIGIYLVYEIINRNISNEDTYNKILSKITRVYDPILVNTNVFPKLNNKSIININNFDDLVDAQAETRKPIYFIIGKDSTAFYLVNDDLFSVYFLKVDNSVETDLEIELKRVELKSSLNLDSIKDFDKTVVVQANDKSYKISPIRDKKEEKKEDTISKKIEMPLPKKETFEEKELDNVFLRKQENTGIINIDSSEDDKKVYINLINFYKTLYTQKIDFSNLTNKQKNRFKKYFDDLKSCNNLTESELQEIDKIKEKIEFHDNEFVSDTEIL